MINFRKKFNDSLSNDDRSRKKRRVRLRRLKHRRQTKLLNLLLTPEEAGITNPVINGSDGKY